MSFHEMGASPRRKNQQPDGLLIQRNCACGTHTGEPECEDCKKKPTIQRFGQADSLDALTRPATTGFDLSAVDTHGPATEDAPETARPASLIVEDAVTELRPGQLRKTAFLDQLRPAVCAEAEVALAGTGRSTADCPYLDRWFNHYRGQSGDHVERAIQRYAPETSNATTAAEYIPLVAARVHEGVARWASTGDLSGVPDDMPMNMADGLGGLVGGIGGLLFAEREGGARAENPVAVRARLGAGRPMDSGVRSRMESAFGQSFAEVRTHTDATGGRLSAEQNAKAFTVGEHIAFGTGEYQPGSLAGDALIAHELAHVTQQAGGGTSTANHAALEQDADRSAVGAVTTLVTGTSTDSRTSRPRTGSRLRLQRCAGNQFKVAATGGRLPAPPLPAAPAGIKGRRGQDARALSIIAIATDTERPVGERAVNTVLQIISQYYPDGLEKINSVTYNETLTGLRTTPVQKEEVVRGDIEVGKAFVEGEKAPPASDKLTPEERFRNDVARRLPRMVLGVGHEIMHVDQNRRGMTGKDRSDEREFLAFHWVVTTPEKAGTGEMGSATRVRSIDVALGYYYCLSSDKRTEHQAKKNELSALRPGEVAASNRKDLGEEPTTCVGDKDSQHRK